MPTTQDEVGEVSGSRSRAGRRRRRPRRTPVADCSGEAQPEAAPSSPRGKRKASPEPSEGSKRRKRTANKRKRTDEKKAATSTGEQAGPASPGTSHASASSSVVSSPLRWPHSPAYIRNPENAHDPAMKAALEAYDELKCKYRAKRKRQQQLVTLDMSIRASCMVNANLQSVRESATKAILQAAKVIFSFSSYVDGKHMARSSGFLIDWDEGSKVGTVLTSARIICSKYTALTQWSGTDEYVPDAEIIAHLLDEDETTLPAILFRYDKHINIAVLKINLDLSAKIPRFSSDINYGQEILVLGRDERLNLTIAHGCVHFMGPTTYERHHYLFTGCEPSIGGMVIDFDGHVLGMANFPGTAYIPSSIILKCLDMWNKFQCIPRLHIGMKLSPIKFLDAIRVERIFRKCNVDSGLIVKEVSHGSIAEELGVRPGDVIDSVNGECVATTVELENLIMRICENHLDQGGAIGSCMDILVENSYEMDSQMNNSSFLNMMNVGSSDINWVGTPDCSPLGEQVTMPPQKGKFSASAKPRSTKGASTKGKNWSTAEDMVLIQAWANTSLDAVTGTDQNSSTYWGWYLAHAERSQRSKAHFKSELKCIR